MISSLHLEFFHTCLQTFKIDSPWGCFDILTVDTLYSKFEFAIQKKKGILLDNCSRIFIFKNSFQTLDPEDISNALIFALNTKWKTNISLVEILPTEQSPGGIPIVSVKNPILD